jgi:hypothetical protein
MRSVVMFGLAVVLVPMCGFIGVAWANLISGALAASVLLYSFAPGFLWDVLRSSVWLAVTTVAAILVGYCAQIVLPGHGIGHLLAQNIVGGGLAVGTYLGLSSLLAPARYRNLATRKLKQLKARFAGAAA